MADSADSRRMHPPDAIFSTWAARDGWPLRRMDWSRPVGAQVRGSLLFAGGRGDFIEKYLEIYGHWHARGWNVTAFDWRGQGRSRAAGAPDLAAFAERAADLADLIAAWRAERPGPHVAVGHSMGGHLLLRTIVEAKPAIDAAVLVAPMIEVNSAPIPAWIAPALCAAMGRTKRGRQPVWKAPKVSPVGSARQHFLTASTERYADELWWWAREPGFNVGTPSWAWIAAAYRSARQSFADARLKAVELPILLLAAAHDRLVSTPAIRRAAALLPHAELEIYPDAAHEILRDADAVRLAALARIDAFFDEQAR